MKNEIDEVILIKLPVQKSSISSVDKGIARLHSSYMEMFENEEHQMVVIRSDKRSIVCKIVSDKFAPKEFIILRTGDMEDLDVREGNEVSIEPYHKITDDLKATWEKFVLKFKRDDEEEGGE